MKKSILTAAAVMSLAACGGAASLTGTTDRNPVAYRAGETMVFTLKASGGSVVRWERTGDDGRSEKGEAKADAPVVVKTSLGRPGFVRLVARLVDGTGKEVARFDGGAGADVGAIRPDNPEPADFDAFWARHKAALAEVSMAGATCREVASGRDDVKLYEVSVPCAGPRPSTGFLSVPAKPGKYPARVLFHGYNASWLPNARNTPKPSDLSSDCIRLYLSAHGYEFNREDDYYRNMRKACGSNGHDYAFDPVQNADPEKAYFCGMTYRVMRGLQYLKGRPEWDGRTLVVEGGSQGGLQSIWAAALDPAVTECRPFIPWNCNIGGPAAGRARGDWHIPWVQALGYYDAANMARRIPKTCRVTVTWAGLGDYICPPSGVMAFYNGLACAKKITWVQGATHGYYPPSAQTFTREGDYPQATGGRLGASEYRMDEKTRSCVLDDSHRYDLRPGLRIACRVRFDEPVKEKGEMIIVRKGNSDLPGAFLLRVDSHKEGEKFSFFVNHAGSPEPRVSIPGPVKVGKWYDIAAGWDGTNSWLTVDGKTARRYRPAKLEPIGCAGELSVGPMFGTVADLSVTGPAVTQPADTSACAGFSICCQATFPVQPEGEISIANKRGEYWLRYDRKKGRPGAFNFFVFLNGTWEPRASYQCDIETGRTYAVSAGWDGKKSWIKIDGELGFPELRQGACRPTAHALSLGAEGKVSVTDFCIRNDKMPIVTMDEFRTRELMPRLGSPARLTGSIVNIGAVLEDCTLEARSANGASVTPAQIAMPCLGEKPIPLEWTVDAGTNGVVRLDFMVRKGGKIVHRHYKKLVFMPKEAPDFSAKAWNPPMAPGRTFHVDSAGGDDARDGLSPATAWKTFANLKGLTLGPGERLLLKRGSVFNEELRVSAHGLAENWAEIGAYGEGMRPQIRRNRHINERCGLVQDAAYLAVRDIVFCNAGSGFSVICDEPGTGHVLIERCLAHHIEGMYRFNSHGIPEWRDEPGATGKGGRSCGIWAGGRHARNVVMRDCESYQCSSGFSVGGYDTFVTRMFCHDNYAHNTSPHPYNLASRSWMTDCVFDASGWHAGAGTMGVMLANNCGYVIRGCHFLNQPDSGSYDQGGIDFECGGENCLVEDCTFRNNAGAAIEVLGLRSPQTRNVHIRRCKFDRNNYAYKNGPAEIQVWGSPKSPRNVACSNGLIEDNGCVLVPGVPFYVNNSPTTNDWTLARNREFDFPEELDRAYPYIDPPVIAVNGEVWTDRPEVALFATLSGGKAALAWEQTEGPACVKFAKSDAACTKATFPAEGDYRVQIKADNGTLWRTSRTAVHILPPGTRTFKAWNFSKNLDTQGWRAEDTGTDFEFLPGTIVFWNSKSFPVRLVCGDYFVVAMKDTSKACLVTPYEMDVGVICSKAGANALRIKMQNHTTSRRMRIWWQRSGPGPAWTLKDSLSFDVKPMDADDSTYTVALPPVGLLKQLKISFSADGEKVTGTCRIDYVWLGKWASAGVAE